MYYPPKSLEMAAQAFEQCGIPPHLWATLLLKLENEIFDAGSSFSLAQDEDNNYEVLKRFPAKFPGMFPHQVSFP